MPKPRNLVKVAVPSESYEQECLVKWLEANEYKFTSIPNSTFTRSHAVKARNRREGLRPGFPDLVIVLKNQCLLFIELKRIKGGKLSPEQQSWLVALNLAPGVTALVCYGAEDARKEILKHEVELRRRYMIEP